MDKRPASVTQGLVGDDAMSPLQTGAEPVPGVARMDQAALPHQLLDHDIVGPDELNDQFIRE